MAPFSRREIRQDRFLRTILAGRHLLQCGGIEHNVDLAQGCRNCGIVAHVADPESKACLVVLVAQPQMMLLAAGLAAAWLFGFTFASGSYWLICTYISPPHGSFCEVAVLPPHVEDVETGAEDGVSTELDVEKGTELDVEKASA